jgi:hypothetical protein
MGIHNEAYFGMLVENRQFGTLAVFRYGGNVGD